MPAVWESLRAHGCSFVEREGSRIRLSRMTGAVRQPSNTTITPRQRGRGGQCSMTSSEHRLQGYPVCTLSKNLPTYHQVDINYCIEFLCTEAECMTGAWTVSI